MEYARRSGLGTALLLLLVLAAPVASGDEDGDAKAKDLLKTYKAEVRDSRDIGDDEGWNAFRRRLTLLREVAALDTEASRKGLARIARKGDRTDDRVLAAQGLARSADLDAVKEVVTTVGRQDDPTLTQATAEALASNGDAAVIAWLTTALPEMKTPGERAVVLRAGTERSLDVDSLCALFDEHVERSASAELAFDVVRALGTAGGDEAAKRILIAAKHEDLRVRLAAADVTPRLPQSDAVDATLRALLTDGTILIRFATLEALGVAKVARLVPEISERLADPDRRTRKTALDVLKTISGKDFGFDIGAWQRWHETKDAAAPPKPGTVPSYYGVPIWSDRLAFILDKSGSMGWPFDPPVTDRMTVAQSELKRVLGILPKGTLFNVVSFESKVSLWKKSEVEADEKSVAKAGRWVDKQESHRGAYTNTFDVLEKTITQNPRIDTIYLLSDGIPEWGDVICREGLLAAVRHWNRFRRVTINTFAITHMSLNPGKYARKASMRRAETFMRDLAAAGGGRYKFILRAPK